MASNKLDRLNHVCFNFCFFQCCYIALTFICGYLVVLLGRAAPNGQIFGLATVIIEGDKTSRFEHSAPRFSPVTTPSSGPQHI
ncbi:unnamed protein product [Auanema sp. JU1783]|nr:unnamed protein product [Auanema sp. JU1783]